MEYIGGVEPPRDNGGEKKRKAEGGGGYQFALPEARRRANKRLGYCECAQHQ
jgi:hypothetical protein